jgi:hypothetical protein
VLLRTSLTSTGSVSSAAAGIQIFGDLPVFFVSVLSPLICPLHKILGEAKNLEKKREKSSVSVIKYCQWIF